MCFLFLPIALLLVKVNRSTLVCFPFPSLCNALKPFCSLQPAPSPAFCFNSNRSETLDELLEACDLVGKIEDVLFQEGIEAPADLDLYSFSELVECGMKPA